MALAAEIPEPGDFVRTSIGDVPVIVTRDRRDAVHVLVNRCAHRGVQLCHSPSGNATTFTCPYHQWSYASDGRLLGVPFRKGVGGHGGMESLLWQEDLKRPARVLGAESGFSTNREPLGASSR